MDALVLSDTDRAELMISQAFSPLVLAVLTTSNADQSTIRHPISTEGIRIWDVTDLGLIVLGCLLGLLLLDDRHRK